MVFPEGIYYNRKKDQCRTPKVNEAFHYIAGLARVLGAKEKRELQFELHVPSLVDTTVPLSNLLKQKFKLIYEYFALEK